MADGGNHLACSVDVTHEFHCAGVTSNMIRSVAARDNHAIEFGGLDAVVRLLRFAGVAEFTGVGLTGNCANSDDLGTGFLQAVNGVPNFHFLIYVVDENSDSLASKFHTTSLPAGNALTPGEVYRLS